MKVSHARIVAVAAVAVLGLVTSQSYAVDLLPTSAIDFATLITEIITKFSVIFTTVIFASLMYWLVRKGLKTMRGALGKA